MPNSSVFIFFMLRTIYRMIYENEKLFFGKKSLNVPNVKLPIFKFFFNIFNFLIHFCWEWHLALYILSNFLASGTSAVSMTSTASTPSVASMTSTASFHQKTYRAWCFYQPWHQNNLSWSPNVWWIIKNPLFYCFLAPFLLEALEDAQHKKNKNWWIRHKWPYFMNT